MSSVLTPRPRHPSRPRITTARSSPRVIRRERETETPLGRPVIIFSPSHPSSSSFPSSRLRVASRHPRSTTERHRTIDARDVVRVRASPFAREVPSRHPSIRVRRRGAHVPSFVSSALPSSSTRATRREKEKRNERAPPLALGRPFRAFECGFESIARRRVDRSRSMRSIGTSTSFSVFYYSV